MSIKPKTKMNIVVIGDVTMDWNLAHIDRSMHKPDVWVPGDYTRACWMRGGASLLADLIDTLASALTEESGVVYSIFQPVFPNQPVDPGDPNYHHSYAIWAPYQDNGRTVWRVKEFLGIDLRTTTEAADEIEWQKVMDDLNHIDLLVIDDSDLGFRNQKNLWSKTLSAVGDNCWILLKNSAPIAQGLLWEHLLKDFADRLVIVTTVGDLRLTEVQISKGLSWEHTAQDITRELVHNPRVSSMARCAYTIVSFGAAGAVVLSRLPFQGYHQQDNIGLQSQLVFDPRVIEDMWEVVHPGGMIGYTTCIVGGVAKQMMDQTKQFDILPGIQSGLLALRDLHKAGYENVGSEEHPHITFPTARVGQVLASDQSPFSIVEIQNLVHFLTTGKEIGSERGFWTILRDKFDENLEQVSPQIALMGAEDALHGVPQGIFGELFTVDRQEIEGFRCIHTLMREYLDQETPQRPLSIAVFGAPGSGKSFGIKQVAKSLASENIEELEFNLSQFASAEDLSKALHLVQDINLKGKLPLIFWDEFDTPLAGRPMGWLSYFLAPMQDGAFHDGEIERPIGSAIFIFAGSTSENMQEFGQILDEETYRTTKVTDFLSRLRGFVNILGPNRQMRPSGDAPPRDPYYLIRRAILLRSILWRNAPHLFKEKSGKRELQIDPGVLRAFLKISAYKHGIRSMEAVVTMSQLSGLTRYERSSLPTEAQLDLHVNGQEFLSLVHQFELTEELIEKLAANLHNVFCDRLIDEGYQWGEKTDNVLKTHSSLKAYEKLPEDEKEQNRDNVRDMVNKLLASGYIMASAYSIEAPIEFPQDHLVDELAKMEHERWLALKESLGWTYGSETDKSKKLHKDMVPWEDLSEEQKDKDRLMVRAIPKILSSEGFNIEKLHFPSLED